jgi:hypothetical protein
LATPTPNNSAEVGFGGSLATYPNPVVDENSAKMRPLSLMPPVAANGSSIVVKLLVMIPNGPLL